MAFIFNMYRGWFLIRANPLDKQAPFLLQLYFHLSTILKIDCFFVHPAYTYSLLFDFIHNLSSTHWVT